jgi:hypothetical protein
MWIRAALRLYGSAALAVLFALVAAPAHAQFQPRGVSNDPTAEQYHVEGAAGLWFPSADMTIASAQFGIIGTSINFTNDLGLQDQHFPELHLVLRPAKQHKFRLQYIPISYTETATLRRTIVFNGQRYDIGVPVNSSLDWKAWRFGYEFDFLTTSRGYGGFVLDFKYTDVTATLATPIVSEFTQARAPIPAIGGVFRVYPVPYVSITGEITGFKLPENLIKDSAGHYVDVDFYGTLNFTSNVGVQLGYRSFDVGYVVKTDTGDFTLKGMYFGIVARY